MRRSGSMIIVLLAAAFMMVGCDSSDSRNSVTASTSWFLQVTTTPSEDLRDWEISVRIQGDQFGEAAPNGTQVLLTASGGNFENGQPAISVSTVGGIARTVLTVPGSGNYEVLIQTVLGDATLQFGVQENG